MSPYTIELTTFEENELRGMASKGYDCGLWDKLRVVHVIDDSTARYAVGHSEADMWECYDEYNEYLDSGDDPFGPFVAVTLRPKLHDLFAEVV